MSVAILLISIFVFAVLPSEAAVMGMIKIKGEIISVDLKSQQITINTSDAKEIVFEFYQNAKVLNKDGKRGVLPDIKIGNKVEISYIVQNSKNMVAIIKLL